MISPNRWTNSCSMAKALNLGREEIVAAGIEIPLRIWGIAWNPMTVLRSRCSSVAEGPSLTQNEG